MEELAMLVAHVEELIERGDQTELADYLNELNISDVEELIDELPEYGPLFMETLSLKRAVNVFRILDFPTQERILKKLPASLIRELLNEMPPDDRTSFFSELKGDVLKRLIILLTPE
jgi:magnesium transporter